MAGDGATILGIGRVAGEYRYEPEFEFPHQRPVEWLNFDEWKMPVPEGLRSTVREIRKLYSVFDESEPSRVLLDLDLAAVFIFTVKVQALRLT